MLGVPVYGGEICLINNHLCWGVECVVQWWHRFPLTSSNFFFLTLGFLLFEGSSGLNCYSHGLLYSHARQFLKLEVLCMKRGYFCAPTVAQFRSPW